MLAYLTRALPKVRQDYLFPVVLSHRTPDRTTEEALGWGDVRQVTHSASCPASPLCWGNRLPCVACASTHSRRYSTDMMCVMSRNRAQPRGKVQSVQKSTRLAALQSACPPLTCRSITQQTAATTLATWGRTGILTARRREQPAAASSSPPKRRHRMTRPVKVGTL
jgi:hypothetical protein